MRKFKRWNI